MGTHSWKAAGAIVAAVLMSPPTAPADMWKCMQADGTVSFNDGGGAGCREVQALPELQSAHAPTGRRSIEPPANSTIIVPVVPRKVTPVLSSRPFPAVSRTVPSLSYHDLPPGMRAKGWSIPNKGDITLVQIDVAHVPGGSGPHLSTDHHFLGEAGGMLGTAVLAAAKATGYDPRFLAVRLTMPVGSILHAGLRVDGPSAGVAWTVAVTSVLLGDSLRSDVCLSGTMDLQLRVGWVGGLEHKIEGCHLLPNFREMLIPAGQNTFAITDKGMARSIGVREVATLAEAYEIATGQPLRAAQ